MLKSVCLLIECIHQYTIHKTHPYHRAQKDKLGKNKIIVRRKKKKIFDLNTKYSIFI